MNVDDALDALFQEIDDLLLEGKFDEVDARLREYNPSEVGEELAIGMLVITLAAKRKLKDREGYLQRVRTYLKDKHPNRVERILKGLS